jgi:hypothetical protein
MPAVPFPEDLPSESERYAAFLKDPRLQEGGKMYKVCAMQQGSRVLGRKVVVFRTLSLHLATLLLSASKLFRRTGNAMESVRCPVCDLSCITPSYITSCTSIFRTSKSVFSSLDGATYCL